MDKRLKTEPSLQPPKPSEAEVVQAIMEVEQATQQASAKSGALPAWPAAGPSWPARNAAAVISITLGMALTVLLVWGARHVVKELLLPAGGQSNGNASEALHTPPDTGQQAEAERLLERLSAGDAAAADQIIEQAERWTGKTESTPKTDQLITTSLNGNDLRARAAAIRAQLALNGIPRDASGLEMLEQAAGNPQQRAFAMWMLGALGNRGVEPAHAAKIIEAYLNDPDVSVRSNAVIGLALLGTDETIPMLLDRFRSDPSVAVQELAGCGLSESGMYTHAQRMEAAASLVGWLDDSVLSPQQHAWVAQALHDISGQNFGTDSAAWQHWYEGSR